jgi:Xaa-Pro aminopeptidase
MNKFDKSFFNGNRLNLVNALPNSLLVVSANSMLQKSADIAFPFRQDSNFWYLTGILEPDLILLINTKSGKTTLFLPEKNSYQIEWDGELDKSELKQKSGIENFAYEKELTEYLRQAKNDKLQICYLAPLPKLVEPYGFYANPARQILETKIKIIEPNPKDIRLDLAKLRQIKQPIEIEAVRKAIEITNKSLNEIKSRLTEFKFESDVERELSIQFLQNGGDGHKFDPIIASGKNASIIHYKKNDSRIENNSLLLLDVGAKVGMFGADISRTWRVGKPSKRQNDVLKAVIDVQQKSIARIKPGVYLKEEQERVNKDLKKHFELLNIDFKPLPTGLSHFLGIDTHDAGDYSAPLTEGSIITIEPGIYLKAEGIGVRVEDNVLVTRNGSENLSAEIDL